VLAKTAVLALLSVAFATGGQILLKSGMTRVGYVGSAELTKPADLALRVGKTTEVWLGLAFFVISAGVWLIVLSRAPLSFAYPFAGLTYVLITAFSRFVLHEHVSFVRWGGIALIIIGIVLVARSAPPGLE
jgi:multidrug transporter EmrE-like cation transporter